MNQGMTGDRKLLWKEVSKANGGKLESCSRIKEGNRKLYLERFKCEGFGRGICGFDGVWRDNYFRGELMLR